MVKATTIALSAILVVFGRAAGAAESLRPVACTVNVQYSLNNVPATPYTKSFVIQPGVIFQDDFSTSTRFKLFTASSSLNAQGSTVIDMNYSDDVGVFATVDFGTTLILRSRSAETVSGHSGFFTSNPSNAAHMTRYSLTCQRQ